MEFDELLPGVLASGPRSGIEVMSDEHGLSVRQSEPRRKRRVTDFVTWTEAWTAYASVVLSAAPHRCHELLGYQALIANAAQQFFPDGWLEYDRRFRAAAANEPSRRWDILEPTTWQLTVTNKSRPTCASCHTTHSSFKCPFRDLRQDSSSSSFRGSRYDTSRSASGPSQRQICRNYNQLRCSSSSCPRVHACLICGQKHPSTHHHTTTSATRTVTASH